MEMIRVLVIDDHPVINEGLPIFFENYPELMVVGTARDGVEGLEKLRRHDPDIIILDLLCRNLTVSRRSGFIYRKNQGLELSSLPVTRTICMSTRRWRRGPEAMYSRAIRFPRWSMPYAKSGAAGSG